MRKQTLTFIILWGTIITTTQCMITTPSFKPYMQVKNPEIQKWRAEKKYCQQNIKFDEILSNNDGFRCLQYALQKITGFKKNIVFSGDKNIDLPINNFFEQIPHPQPGCLAVYTDEQLEVQHFAVAIDSITFKSKFGTNKTIWQHRLFDVSPGYENHVYFFILWQKYKDNPEQLLQDLEQAALYQELKTNLNCKPLI